ncbi:MAG: BamA/TamA family outer membrane protein [Cyclobacteriaceae bacterium]
MKKFIYSCILLVGFCFSGQAQKSEEAVFRSDTLGNNQKGFNLIGLPIAFVTPETSFGFGGGAQVFLLNKSNVYNSRSSNILVSGIYTLKNQLFLDLKPQIYLNKGDYLLDMSYKFKLFPNVFWGVGNNNPDEFEEDYEMTSSELKVAFLKRLPPHLNFGFEYVLDFYDVTKTEEGGLLDGEGIVGNDKAIASGLGVIFNLDDRDDVAAPLSGNFVQLNARFASKSFGSTNSFNKYFTDLRTYRPLGKKSVLAIQIYYESAYGDVPFQAKSWYGGGERARGYFRGRFIENHMYVAQAEYRWRFHPRWTAAAFGLVGEVASLPENFFSEVKPGFGGGFRFKFVKTQNAWLRADIGIGKDGNNGFYFGVNEAF